MCIKIFITLPAIVFKRKMLHSEHNYKENIFYCHLIKWNGEKPRTIKIYRKAFFFSFTAHRVNQPVGIAFNLNTQFNLGKYMLILKQIRIGN